jgi:hypothetical protein
LIQQRIISRYLFDPQARKMWHCCHDSHSFR